MKLPDYIEIAFVIDTGECLIRFSKKYNRWHRYKITDGKYERVK